MKTTRVNILTYFDQGFVYGERLNKRQARVLKHPPTYNMHFLYVDCFSWLQVVRVENESDIPVSTGCSGWS